ncbi:MAG: hypothetical protein JWM85_2030 [Acidimicrobiaceae bacterium]|nr:hypothetical protein [Acidimicrobiaceae bacterium]
MRRETGDRRLKAERELFEVHARLGVARSELEVVEAQHAALAEIAEESRVRMLIAETAMAHREWDEARRHQETLERACRAARSRVSDLERAQDELLDHLLV